MKRKNTNLQTRLYLIAAVIVLIGMGGATLIYLTAENNSDNVLSYENTKKYKHDLELYGGKTNVLISEFMGWFVGLWHGKSLAFIIACFTIFISFGLFLVAKHSPSRLKSDSRDVNNQSGIK